MPSPAGYSRRDGESDDSDVAHGFRTFADYRIRILLADGTRPWRRRRQPPSRSSSRVLPEEGKTNCRFHGRFT